MGSLVCPKCKKGTLASSFVPVQMFAENKRGTASHVSANYCNSYGYILEFYVDNPENVK